MPDPALPAAVVYIATSLDGYIAREDGGLDWLVERGREDGGDHGYAAFMAGVDALVLGRKTYETVLAFDAWPYEGTRVVVLSGGRPPVPPELEGRVEVLDLAPADLLRHLGEGGARRVYVDGGVTVQRFLRAGLVRELVVTRVPVLLGAGRPLFGSLEADVEWEHVGTEAFPSGLVQSRYRLAAPA